MLNKALDQVTLDDIRRLVQERWPEGKAIDYKRDLYGRADSDKKELLKDVSSFANTDGGDLIIGVDEDGGLPTAIPGVAVADVDAEKLRLEETIRRGVEPRIDFAIHTVETGSGTVVFVIRVRESWVLPHRVVFQGKFGEFWARNSAGKYSMDTTELRRAFNLSETLYERVRGFRKERVDEALLGNGPMPLREGAKVILHLIPLESVRSRTTLDFGDVGALSTAFPPLGHRQAGGWGPRLNFDGLLVSSRAASPNSFNSYVQLYRDGIIEAALDGIDYEESGARLLRTGFFERNLLSDIPLYLKGYRAARIGAPIWAFLTLVGVKGATIRPGPYYLDTPHPIDRDVLHLPDFVIEDLDRPVIESLRACFDLIWNAAGLPGSLNFDEQGRFRST